MNNRQLMLLKTQKNLSIAVLVDVENVSADLVIIALEEIKRLDGNVEIIKAYAD